MYNQLLSPYREQIDFIEGSARSMKQTVCEWSDINSGTYHLEGLAKMKARLEKDLLSLGGEQETIQSNMLEEVSDEGEIKQIKVGDCLSITKRKEAPFQILLCGHMDTVFAKTHAFQHVTELSSNCLNGPGLTDMKGGLLVMSYALQALEQSPMASQIGWQVLINADEEIGSLGSSDAIKAACNNKNLALVYEPSMNDKGTLAGERKGSGKFSIIVKGRAAHAGRAFHEGRNAIAVLAEIVAELHALNGQRKGVTINLGYITGGGALNVVPDNAVAKCDIRLEEESDKAWFINALNKVKEKHHQKDGISVLIHGAFGRTPKKISPAILTLLQKIQSVGQMLEMDIDWAPSGGCCDGNNIASHGVPVVDTLGVRGGDIHKATEYLMVDSLVERAKLSAVLLMMLAKEQE
jgi:glutamate carboxypeptidase